MQVYNVKDKNNCWDYPTLQNKYSNPYMMRLSARQNSDLKFGKRYIKLLLM
jgi:hypothetical protein